MQLIPLGLSVRIRGRVCRATRDRANQGTSRTPCDNTDVIIQEWSRELRESEWSIELYVDERGRSPLEEFIQSVDLPMQQKIARTIRQLEEFGTSLRMPLTRPMTGYPFWELRVQMAGNISRIFYFAAHGRRMVLLHGFTKKGANAPKGELEIAPRRYADYQRRHS